MTLTCQHEYEHSTLVEDSSHLQLGEGGGGGAEVNSKNVFICRKKGVIKINIYELKEVSEVFNEKAIYYILNFSKHEIDFCLIYPLPTHKNRKKLSSQTKLDFPALVKVGCGLCRGRRIRAGVRVVFSR